MHRIRIIIFCLLFVAPGVEAQVPFAKEFWLNENSVPVKVNDLLYAGSDFMWLATDNGLYRFNGRTFTLIGDTTREAATSVAEVDGNVYVGYRSGNISIVRNEQLYQLNISLHRPSSAITSIHGNEFLLFLTTEDEGLFIVVNGVGLQLTTENGLTDNFIYDAMLNGDQLMVATDRGINRVYWNGQGPVVKVLTTLQGLPDNIIRVIRPVHQTKTAWIGTQEGGVVLYDGRNGILRNFRIAHPWAWGQVNDIFPVSEKEIWAATEEGYLLHVNVAGDSMDVQPFTYDGVKMNRLVIDKTGNIWCATNKGLLMNTALYAHNFELPSGFQLKDLTTMTFDKHNRLWFTQNDALFCLSPANHGQPEFVVRTDAAITCLYADQEDNIWIGTFGEGLFVYKQQQLIAVNNIASLAEGHILSIAAVADRLWIASLNGVEEASIVDGNKGILNILKRHNKVSGTGSDYVYQLYPDSRGNMWMATDGGGICMYDGKEYHRWDNSSGFTSQVVYSVAEDAYGAIWAGTLEKGLFRFSNGSWQQFTKTDGLQDMNVYALKGTASGEVIVVNDDGIDEWYPVSKQFRHFNRRLGVSIDSTITIPNCLAADKARNVWVPFEHGFIIFKNLDNYDVTPEVHINTISLFFKQLQTERHYFAYDENHISFHYTGVNYSNPERLHYRYRLDNYDTTWIYTNDEVIPFVQLPPGNYTFRVQASLNNSFTNAAEDKYSFIVSKPYWQHTWFITIVVLGLFGGGYGYIKIRERNLKNMSRLQRERMVFEYEHLKSQVNPHFLFNSLNTLVSLIEDDKNAAVDYTVHLSDLYRNMLSYKDQDLIWLSEEYEIITNYMYIQKSRFGSALHLDVQIAEHLFRTKKIVPLALQLLVENAIKHNIVSLAKPLVISIVANEEQIIVSNPVQLKTSKEKGAGLGLINIEKRYSLLTNRSTKFGIEENKYVVILPLL